MIDVACVVVMFVAFHSVIAESRIPRFGGQRSVFCFHQWLLFSASFPLQNSSFNRSGFEGNSSSQAPHHLMRASVRETSNIKSASLSAAPQPMNKIPDKVKCVFVHSHRLCELRIR